MRILHIVSNISRRSGIMSFLMSYYRNIDNREFQFDFLYYEEREHNYEKEIMELGGKTYCTPSPISFFGFCTYINDFCRKHEKEYDIIQLHDPYLIIMYRSMCRKLKCKCFISHAHSTRTSDSMLGDFRNRLFMMLNIVKPDYLFACSKVAGIKTFGKKFSDIGIVVNNAIDVERFQNSKEKREYNRKRLGIEESLVIGHIGNFTGPKNHPFIVDVFSHILKKKKDVVLVLVGGGDRVGAIKDKCLKLGIAENVIFTGVREDVDEIISAFDVFFFPSLFEGLGISLIEAQASGIPCVYSDQVPFETNIIQKNNRVLKLEDPIERWTESLLDKSFFIEYGATEMVREKGFDIYVETKRLESLYRELVAYKE